MKLRTSVSNIRRVRLALAKAIACGTLFALPACAIPDYRLPGQGMELPANFPVPGQLGGGTISLESSARLGIEQFYRDPVLTSLIDQALGNNRELRMLDEEVLIARNEIKARQGAYLPFVTAQASAGLEKPSDFTPLGAAEKILEPLPGKHFPDPMPDYLLGLNFFWSVDIWRELHNAKDAAEKRYLAASERRNFFVTHLVAEVAEKYYELMALDKRMEALDKIIELQEQTLDIAKTKKEAGRGNILPVQRFEAEVRKNQSEKMIVRQDIVEAENRINFLLNRFPQPVERMSAAFLDLTLPLSLGAPAQLLLNRPDIRQAERELEAAGIDVLVARAHFFPKLDLNGAVGYEAFDPKYLFYTPEALFANVAGDFVAPLINKKAIQAEYQSANAKQLQSVYNYQKVILNAFTEVVNRMAMAENYRRSIDLKKQQLDALEASVDTASKLFLNARAEYSEVLFAQRDLIDARIVLIETKKQQLTAIVNAYQALGGGLLRSSPGEAPQPMPPMLPQPQPVPPLMPQPLPGPGLPAIPAVPAVPPMLPPIPR